MGPSKVHLLSIMYLIKSKFTLGGRSGIIFHEIQGVRNVAWFVVRTDAPATPLPPPSTNRIRIHQPHLSTAWIRRSFWVVARFLATNHDSYPPTNHPPRSTAIHRDRPTSYYIYSMNTLTRRLSHHPRPTQPTNGFGTKCPRAAIRHGFRPT